MFSVDTIPVSPDILQLVAEVDEFKGAWRAIGALSPERLSSLRRVATIESIGSSTRIEGSRLSDHEVEGLLGQLHVESFASRDEQEVAGYARAMELAFRSFDDIPLTENHIRQLHRDLLQYSEKDAHHRGAYKTAPNSVAAFDSEGNQMGIVFETASPFETPGKMTALVDWTREALETRSVHPLLSIGVFVVVFLDIHPFQDGNGRLSRILTTLLLLRAGYAYVPFYSLESIVEINKESYYLALRRTQTTTRTSSPDFSPWIDFFLTTLVEQTRRLARKVEMANLAAPPLPELSVRILEHAITHGRVTMGAMIRETGISRNTLKEHFRRLLEDGHLTLHGAGRGAWYERRR